MKEGTIPFPQYRHCTERDDGTSPAFGVIAWWVSTQLGGRGTLLLSIQVFTISSEVLLSGSRVQKSGGKKFNPKES